MIPSELVQGQEPERQTGTANLQELRRQVQMAKENGEKMEEKDVEKADEMKEMEEKTPNIESVSAEILVRHETYGCGKVVEEDDTCLLYTSSLPP